MPQRVARKIPEDAVVPTQACHACPWWLGYLLASPLRRLVENPDTLVLPLIRPGDRVLELGPAMGYFSLPMARKVGPQGKVTCVEVQQIMLDKLRQRLARKRLSDRAELRLCSQQDLGLAEDEASFDLAVAIHVVHETASPKDTVVTLARCLKPGGKLLLVEPPGHCPVEVYRAEMAAMQQTGLRELPHPLAANRRYLTLWQKDL